MPRSHQHPRKLDADDIKRKITQQNTQRISLSPSFTHWLTLYVNFLLRLCLSLIKVFLRRFSRLSRWQEKDFLGSCLLELWELSAFCLIQKTFLMSNGEATLDYCCSRFMEGREHSYDVVRSFSSKTGKLGVSRIHFCSDRGRIAPTFGGVLCTFVLKDGSDLMRVGHSIPKYLKRIDQFFLISWFLAKHFFPSKCIDCIRASVVSGSI